ncbi:extracellular solute-binding protein [Caulobacter sp. X]|uniref:extracellular solute-binding protein n=1 Tax=Caulobacter sp. X TaxID=2048901 RepID=UPI000C148F8A|nr:extracellular solute-binding protein [Caulobacter sp. X]PIB95245.1 sugar ABC transporter substrate-binding protein [Caulobacter sp. X]
MTALRGVTWDHERGYDPLVATAALWAEQTGVKVTWEKRSLQAFADVPIARLAETFDLIVIDHPHVGQLARDGSVTALPDPEPRLEPTVGASAESYVWEGQRYAYAIDAACQMYARRAGSPTPLIRTWDDLLGEDAKRFRAVTPLKPVDAFDALLTFAASLGAPVPSDGAAFIERGVTERGLAVLKAMFRLGPAEAVDWNPIHVLEILSSDQAEFDQSPCLFGYVNYAREGFRTRLLEYADLPVFAGVGQRAGILGGAGIAVSASSAHRDAAITHAAWLASVGVQAGAYLANNGQPAATGAWDAAQARGEATGFFAGGRATIDAAWTRPRDEWFLGFVDDVCELMPNFFLKDIPTSTFADTLDALYQHHRQAGRA